MGGLGSSPTPAAGCGAVAAGVFGSAVAGAVVVVVSEVPWPIGCDGLVASGACHGAGFDDGSPLLAECAVWLAVSACGAAAAPALVFASVLGALGLALYVGAAGV